MSRRDVNLYLLETQNLYQELLGNLDDFKQLAAEGRITQIEYDNALKEIDVAKTNYERIAYIVFLLNKPNRPSRKPSALEMSWYEGLKGASKEAILDETRDVLADIKKLIKDKKEEVK